MFFDFLTEGDLTPRAVIRTDESISNALTLSKVTQRFDIPVYFDYEEVSIFERAFMQLDVLDMPVRGWLDVPDLFLDEEDEAQFMSQAS